MKDNCMVNTYSNAPSYLVSCIIPVYNQAKYLPQALESIFAQTYHKTEIIVVDDGSTDNTQLVISAYKGKLKRLHQDQKGPASARNLGIQHANGDLIAFLDADDIWLPEKLFEQVGVFHRNPELDLCFTHMENFREPEFDSCEPLPVIDERVKLAHTFHVNTVLMKSALFKTIGLFNQKMSHAEDTDLFMRLNNAGVRMKVIQKVLVRRRLHSGNLTRNMNYFSRDQLLRFAKAAVNRRKPAKQSHIKES